MCVYLPVDSKSSSILYFARGENDREERLEGRESEKERDAERGERNWIKQREERLVGKNNGILQFRTHARILRYWFAYIMFRSSYFRSVSTLIFSFS